MSPQFVDFNGDGHLDIVAGTFDGSPHVAFGSEAGFQQPTWILDEKGERILINAFWNTDAKKWDETTRCNPEGDPLPKGHMTSAVAFDWNGDGAWDLLLGDYTNGHIYLRENRGSNKEPKFSGTNQPVMAGGKPLKVEGKLTTMRPVDWDKDGRLDLLCGSFGDSYEQAAGGGVFLFRDEGKGKTPTFSAPLTFIPVSHKGQASATRPDAGLYPEAFDWNGDGKLDLVVGGYSMWQPKARTLSAEEKDRVAELRQEIGVITKKSSDLNREIAAAAKGLEGDAARQRMVEERKRHADALNGLNASRKKLQSELDGLVPSPQRVSYVWVYLNAASGGASTGHR